jgi:hypothetical protein
VNNVVGRVRRLDGQRRRWRLRLRFDGGRRLRGDQLIAQRLIGVDDQPFDPRDRGRDILRPHALRQHGREQSDFQFQRRPNAVLGGKHERQSTVAKGEGEIAGRPQAHPLIDDFCQQPVALDPLQFIEVDLRDLAPKQQRGCVCAIHVRPSMSPQRIRPDLELGGHGGARQAQGQRRLDLRAVPTAANAASAAAGAVTGRFVAHVQTAFAIGSQTLRAVLPSLDSRGDEGRAA